jgi:hypothetical protein
MPEERVTGDRIESHLDVGGNFSGMAAVGKDIRQEQRIGDGAVVTEAEVAELHARFRELRELVEGSAPPESRAAALERVDELEQAVLRDEPKLSTMEYVRDWFREHVPGLAGAVTGVVVNPIVGKLVAAAGDWLAEEFRRRFGRTPA